jgi:diphthamide synthase (EF-2-diphthine--ammonia ligase)
MGQKELVHDKRSDGTELVQKEVFGDNYENQFLEALLELKIKGVTGIVFGDIDVKENRHWAENVCLRAVLDSYFPLWDIDQKTILTDFIRSGFKAMVVALYQKYLGEGELGRELDEEWVDFIGVSSEGGHSIDILRREWRIPYLRS